jgi:hypothetical protein
VRNRITTHIETLNGNTWNHIGIIEPDNFWDWWDTLNDTDITHHTTHDSGLPGDLPDNLSDTTRHALTNGANCAQIFTITTTAALTAVITRTDNDTTADGAQARLICLEAN